MFVTANDLDALPAAPLSAAEARSRARSTVVLNILGRTCAVYFDDVDAALAFGARYADLQTVADTYDAEAFSVQDPAGGRWFWSPGSAAFRWPHEACDPELQTFFTDAAAITSFFLQRADGVLSLHAASVAIPGAAAAIIGESNVGKTTTAIACARIGLRLFGDERCIIDRAARVHPFPRALNIRAGSREVLASDRDADDDTFAQRMRARSPGALHDLRFAELLGSWSPPDPEPLRAVFLLDGLGDEPSLRSTTAADAVRAAARWAHGAGAGVEKISRLLDLFAPLQCYRLVLGTPSASAGTIAAVLSSCV
jgi:hypothetical protein